MKQPELCPTAERLDDYLEGRADPGDAAALEGHIGRCDPCRRVVAALARQDAPDSRDEATR